jgi:8-oxo-dGTP pyrophosphatase MutT (NUDIX family)
MPSDVRHDVGVNTSREQVSALIDEMVARRPPIDKREAASIERFRRDLARLVDPCSEDADTTHVTASALVVGPRGIVLHRHKRLGIWLQPGGHIDQGEAPDVAALREVLEETGLRGEHVSSPPRLVHVDAHDGPRGHFHLDLRYLIWAGDAEPSPPQGESQDVRWWSWAEALGHNEPGLAGAIKMLAAIL